MLTSILRTVSGVVFKVVIPARYGSTRLAGKPLRELGGHPMLWHVYQRGLESGANEVLVATDDERILDAANAFGAEVCMTASSHPSGTDRIEEVTRLRGWEPETIVVNLQGDEPLMPPALLTQVAESLAAHSHAGMATLCTPIRDSAELFDPHVVKVVRNRRGDALLFSRAALPWDRDAFQEQPPRLQPEAAHARHIGLYAYRVDFLQRYVAWPPCALERTESLEQLRALWNGESIHVAEAAEVPGHGVDTAEDLAHVARILERRRDGAPGQ